MRIHDQSIFTEAKVFCPLCYVLLPREPMTPWLLQPILAIAHADCVLDGTEAVGEMRKK